MGDEQNGQGKSRLDRLEGLMELLIDDHLKFSDEHKKLLTAQVVLAEMQQRAEKRMEQLDLKMAELAEVQKDTAERLNALIAVVDDLVRRNPERLQ
jgi:hypothetical protein